MSTSTTSTTSFPQQQQQQQQRRLKQQQQQQHHHLKKHSTTTTDRNRDVLSIHVPQPHFQFIDLQTLTRMMIKNNDRENKSKSSDSSDSSDTSVVELIIVDVRDEDYVGGHIKGAIHKSFDHFEQSVQHMDEWIPPLSMAATSQLENKNKKVNIVFTGMHSEQRGPFCASTFAEELEKRQQQQPQLLKNNIQIYVLIDGVAGWLKHHVGTSEQHMFVEQYDEKQWKRDATGHYLHILDSQVLEFCN